MPLAAADETRQYPWSVEPAWDELLSNLEERLGMYVLRPRLATADSLLAGFSLGRDDGVAGGFQAWFATAHPAEGGYPNPVHHATVLADDLFGKRPEELDDDEEKVAVQRLCSLYRQYLAPAL